MCRYVERAKEIVNSVAVNDANVDPLVRKLRDEIHALQELLEQKSAIITEHEARLLYIIAMSQYLKPCFRLKNFSVFVKTDMTVSSLQHMLLSLPS